MNAMYSRKGGLHPLHPNIEMGTERLSGWAVQLYRPSSEIVEGEPPRYKSLSGIPSNMSRTLKHAGHVHTFMGTACTSSVVAGFMVGDRFVYGDWGARAIMSRSVSTHEVLIIEPGYAPTSSARVTADTLVFVAQRYSEVDGSFVENTLILVNTANTRDVALPPECADAISVRVYGESMYVMSGVNGTVCRKSFVDVDQGEWAVVFTPNFRHVAIWPDFGSVAFLSFDMYDSECAFMLYNAGPVVRTTVGLVCSGNMTTDYFPRGILSSSTWTSDGVVHAGGDIVVAHGEAHLFTGEGSWGATASSVQDTSMATSKHIRLRAGSKDHVVCGSGFRHPWTASFDQLDDAFFVGDVGLASFEEVTRIPLDDACASLTAPHFYGWPLYEGFMRGQLEAHQNEGTSIRWPMFVEQHVCEDSDALVVPWVGVCGGVLLTWGIAFGIAYLRNAFNIREIFRRGLKHRRFFSICAILTSSVALALSSTLILVPWVRSDTVSFSTWISTVASGFHSPSGSSRTSLAKKLLWENVNRSAYPIPVCVAIAIAAATSALGLVWLNALAVAADVALLATTCTIVAGYEGYVIDGRFVAIAALALVFHVSGLILHSIAHFRLIRHKYSPV